MNLITLDKISKSYSEKILLDNVTLNINEGDKIGLIGLNGAGKSTLLKIVAGKDEFFSGEVTKSKDLRIEYLSQNTEYKDETTVLDQVFHGDNIEMKLLKEYELLLETINNSEFSEELNNKLIALQSKIDNLNLWNLESEAKTILTKLGINNYNVKMSTLSGGQKKRVFLASALISPCNLLILDEPTNHLDSSSIEWLEDYCLDRVANRTIELDRGKLYSYDGNYSYFLEKKAERLELEAAMEEKRQKLILKELKWVRRGAKARTTKQKARLQRFDELVNQEYIAAPENIDMPFVGRRLGKKTIELYNISKRYNEKVLLKDFSYIFLKSDRIGIIGDNGMGKTTLTNLINDSVKVDSGSIEIGDTVKICTFAQDDSHMDLNMRAIDYIKEGGETIPTEDGTVITASQLAERFLFDGILQYTTINKLSGGERRRLHLLRILMEAPNVLILDEPTNDLDIETLKILEDFIDEFTGIVIVVSHDRYFLDRTCNKIFSFEGKGTIKIYNGNYSDYLIHKEIELINGKDTNNKKVTVKKEYVKTKEDNPKFSFKEQKEFETIYNDIDDLEEKISNIDKQMEENPSNYGLLNELTNEKEALEEELLYKYERVEYLEGLSKRIEEYKKK